MAKAVNFLEKHLQIIVMCISILGGIAGMYSSVCAQNEIDTNDKIGLERRLSNLETKMDLILNHFKLEDKSN